ncbi:MAG TPA: lipocalin family protein [Chitinophagaceae bacterium]|nr:lipocalin family protein [Chitinophagaceae bacterium]
MKSNSIFRALSSKAILVLIGITIFSTSHAQSIIGKWRGVSVKNYYSAEFAQKLGKPMEEKTAKDVGNSEIEYKSDHTFIINFSPANSKEVMTMKGTWSLSGDELKSTLEAQYNPMKKTTSATVSISSNTMITTAEIPPPSRITKTISTSTRM